jgi:hypothetical protein
MKEKYTESYIEQYLLGQLSPEEANTFEEDLEKDDNLRAEVEFQRSLFASIQDIDDDEQTLVAIQSAGKRFEVKQKKSKAGRKGGTRFRIITWIAAAASVALIAFAIHQFSGKSINGDVLFAAYFQPATMLEIERSSESAPTDTILFQAYLLYEDQKYAESLDQFELHFEQQLPSPKNLNYAGMAALSSDPQEISTAKRYFLNILDYGDTIYKNGAQWNLALIGIKSGDIKGAKILLKEITRAEENKYTERAKKLLGDL